MHKWYTGFDWLSETEIEEAFPLDAVPENIHIETLDETEATTADMSVDVFTCWLNEGRHDCEVAQTLLHLWIHTLPASKHDTLYDFFQQLLAEYQCENVEHKSTNTLPVFWLAEKIRALGTLPFHIDASTSPEGSC